MNVTPISKGSDTWNGYKIVGDNLDRNIKPRYRRLDQQTVSLHCFHYYTVRDRIDISGIPDEYKPSFYTAASKLPLDVLLPSSSDHLAMVHNFGILVSRVLVEELAYFSTTFEGVVTTHIPHCHSDEMARKSETVSVL